jgi:hypothetical protein
LWLKNCGFGDDWLKVVKATVVVVVVVGEVIVGLVLKTQSYK